MMMVNKYLLREDAPLDPEAWRLLDETMVEAAKTILAGRRILEIEGPFGLGLKAVPLQDCCMDNGLIASPVVPVSLVQKNFMMSKRDLAAYERDHLPLNLDGVAMAAIETAKIEDNLVFFGVAGCTGLLSEEDATELKLSSWNTVGKAADDIIKGITQLDDAGFHGPYTLALSPARYNLLMRRYPQGTTEYEHMQTIVTKGVVKAPVLPKGGVLLAAGRQFNSIVMGQDMSVGFIGPAGADLEFSVSESLALMIRQPGSICALIE
jgi:uncharacterized linocin/CFP29 family protein